MWELQWSLKRCVVGDIGDCPERKRKINGRGGMGWVEENEGAVTAV